MYQLINANKEYISSRSGKYILTDNKEFGNVFPLQEAQEKLKFFNPLFSCVFLISEYRKSKYFHQLVTYNLRDMQSKHGFETTAERSLLMSKIRSRNTKAEILFRKELWRLGYRYRMNFLQTSRQTRYSILGQKSHRLH